MKLSIHSLRVIFPSVLPGSTRALLLFMSKATLEMGKIIGLTNWRLRGLQLAIQSNRLGDFKTLCETTRREFYDDPNGTNYAQARYLCYYLQEKKLLRKFYHQFLKDAESDPSGYETLQQTLKAKDMTKFSGELGNVCIGLGVFPKCFDLG